MFYLMYQLQKLLQTRGLQRQVKESLSREFCYSIAGSALDLSMTGSAGNARVWQLIFLFLKFHFVIIVSVKMDINVSF